MKEVIVKSLFVALLFGATATLTCCQPSTPKAGESPLNISVYLDLSDRLLKGGTPDQKERDLAIVDTIAGLFQEATISPAILKCENKMKVFFYPSPPSAKIDTLAGSLSIDIGKLKGIDKRMAAEGFKSKLHGNLSEIYDLTLAEQNWIGCDIWGFFSDPTKLDVQCMDKCARNIIIILTDGFIYHENNVSKDGKHGYTYISPTTLADSSSYLIVDRNDLKDVEVLVLEIAPDSQNLTMGQKKKLKRVLTDWFSAMGVHKLQIAETDLPSTTANVIKKFLN